MARPDASGHATLPCMTPKPPELLSNADASDAKNWLEGKMTRPDLMRLAIQLHLV